MPVKLYLGWATQNVSFMVTQSTGLS